MATTTTTPETEFPETQQQKLHMEPSESLKITITENSEILQDEASSPEFEWAISIKKSLEQARGDHATSSLDKISIFKFPHHLRTSSSSDDKSFVPQVVSIGPYHRGKSCFRQMERHKWRFLTNVLKRNNHDIRLYLDSMIKTEENARSCYEGTISLSCNEFVEMCVVDGCFMIELFRGAAEGFTKLGYSRNDPVFAMRGLMHSIQRDMVMLENQLPLFVLDRLLEIQLGIPRTMGLVRNLALRFFDSLMPTDESLTKFDKVDPLTDQGSTHCLDVIWRSLLRPRPKRRISMKRCSHTDRVADKRHQQVIHCVTELKEAGIKFKKRKTGRFSNITFKNGVLKMPRLLIHDGTKTLFLNLIAFEQCHMDGSNDITSYVMFMDSLINSTDDVRHLHYHGIIEHWLGSDAEVADLFNKLCQEVVLDFNDSYLSPLSAAVNRYYNNKWNTWCASLRQNYFHNPWTTISFIAGVVLLLLTFAQTYYSVYAYYRPPH